MKTTIASALMTAVGFSACAVPSSGVHRPQQVERARAPGTRSVRVFGGAALMPNSAVDVRIVGGPGQASPPSDLDLGSVYGAAIGVALTDRWDGELEVSSTSIEGNFDGQPNYGTLNATTSWTAVMLNAVYRPVTTLPFDPYVGLGAGYVPDLEFQVSSGAASKRDPRVAAQLFIGCEISGSGPLSGFLEARHARIFDSVVGSASLGSAASAHVELEAVSTSLLLGVRYRW